MNYEILMSVQLGAEIQNMPLSLKKTQKPHKSSFHNSFSTVIYWSYEFILYQGMNQLYEIWKWEARLH